MNFSHRLATPHDLPALTELMALAIDELQKGFLSADQIAASRAIMGLDTQLIDDATYFVVEAGPVVAGCGGWSRRNTLYGGDHTPGRNAALLDPTTDAARVRAMYTNPALARRGVGRLLLSLCEATPRLKASAVWNSPARCRASLFTHPADTNQSSGSLTIAAGSPFL